MCDMHCTVQMHRLGGEGRREEERGRRSTDEHDKVLSPQGAVSLRGQIVRHRLVLMQGRIMTDKVEEDGFFWERG